MKKALLTLLVTACAASVLAQGTITFNNRVAGVVDARVWGVNSAAPNTLVQGNDATGVPAGTADYAGRTKLEGTAYTAQLFGGAVGTAEADLVALTPTLNFRTGSAAGITTTPAPAVSVPGVAEGQAAVIQLRAWDNMGGTVTTWDQVLANNDVARGWSTAFTSLPLGGTLTTPPNLVGLTSFGLFIVPEPSTIALGVLGIGALLLFRRRK